MSQKSVGLAVKEIKLQETRAKLVSELEKIVLSVMDLDRSVFKNHDWEEEIYRGFK